MNAVAPTRLSDLGLFRNVSIRLVTDLLEQAGTDARVIEPGTPQDIDAPLLFVVDGELRVTSPPATAAATDGGTAIESILGTGDVHWQGTRHATQRCARVAAHGPDQARVLPLTPARLQEMARASFSLAWSLARVPALEPLIRPAVRVHALWMSADAGFPVPVEALGELLAAALALEFAEATAVLVAEPDAPVLRVWRAERFVAVPFAWSGAGADIADGIAAALDATQPAGNPRPPFYHVLFVRPSAPADPPAALAGLHVHRVVHAAERIPDRMPPGLARALPPAARNPDTAGDPYFSSFIPCVLVPPPAARPPAPATLPESVTTLWQMAVGRLGGRRERFRSEPIANGGIAGSNGRRPARATRRVRDLCRLGYDPLALRRLWARWSATGEFATRAFESDGVRATSATWARAVTNRRVGIALSGGGASTYRMVPFLHALDDACVPVDVVSGISGGSLLGAYYACDGVRGIDAYVARGPVYQIMAELSTAWSWFIEAIVDWDLGAAGIEEMQTRFVPLTTALPPHGPPQPHAVVRGTLGEGVRASGAAPGLFARTKKSGTLYSDGVSSTPIPTRALSDYGADFLIACNAIPGPDRRNPIASWPGGEFLYERCAAVGRICDLWVAGAFLLQQISRDSAEEADVFVECTPQDAPLVECFQFDHADELVRQAKADPRMRDGIARCVARWHEFVGQ